MPKTPSVSLTNAASYSTAHYLLQGLNEIGVEYLFCNFGTDHAPLIEELARFEADGLRSPKVVPALMRMSRSIWRVDTPK